MADKSSRTEKPTAKRRREARRDGRVARSPDIVAWAGMLGFSFIAPAVFHSAAQRLTDLVGQAGQAAGHPAAADDLRVLGAGFTDLVAVLAPVAGMAVALAVAGTVAQVGLGLSPGSLRPKFSRLNPLTGLKRLVSPAGGWELGKQAVKLGMVGAVAYRLVSSLLDNINGSQPLDLGTAVGAAAAAGLSLIRTAAMVGLVLAVADWAFQKHRLMGALRMTKQEVKDENRQAEGDPLVKGQIRARARKLSRLRMMAAVAGADVVVANPTHYAVALVYQRGSGGAPRVVARGAGTLALRIKSEAAAHGVPVVEDPPLARAIYAACELDMEIPRSLYKAVARLLAFVYSLPAMRRWGPAVAHTTPAGLLSSTAAAPGR